MRRKNPVLKMEGRCESDRAGDEVYPATFGDEEKNGLKLDDDGVKVTDFLGKLFRRNFSSTSCLVTSSTKHKDPTSK